MHETTRFELPEDAAPKIRALYDYWGSIHPAAGGLPGRQHLDPLDIPQLLPSIWMVDVRPAPLRFRFRLVGTAIVKFTGRDATGLWLDQVYPDYENTVAFRIHRDCVAKGEPAYRKSKVLSNPGRDFVEAERVYLPLAGNGQDVDILLIMTLYSGDTPVARQQPATSQVSPAQ